MGYTPEWRQKAMELHRLGRLALSDFAGREDLSVTLVDLTEALLDLKQAVISDDADGADLFMAEVLELLFELESEEGGS